MSGRTMRTFAVAAALVVAALGLSGCVYYPTYGYPYSTAYAPAPPVYGSVTIGGGWYGGWGGDRDDDDHDHDHGGWHH